MIRKHENRPEFPKRAIVTAGMPYGNKSLHFGHIGGVFIPADIFARFLRDRIGQENVIFISGTDCYGSAIELGYEQAKENGFTGDIERYVKGNNEKQKEILDAYQISLNIYEGSAIGNSGKTHYQVTQQIFNKLYENKDLKIEKTKQFFDSSKGIFLNGRQVKGRCPINGCKSDVAYAEECALGHQFDPSELIAPRSVVSDEIPILVDVENWFFDVPQYREEINKALTSWKKAPFYRDVLGTVIEDFLAKPSIYVKKEEVELISQIEGFPEFVVVDEKNKQSSSIVLANLEARKHAVEMLRRNGIRYRTGKTLVPLRISGNVKWGIKVPELEGKEGLTFWVWPESLWAPISFTIAYLKEQNRDTDWKAWWKSDQAKVYQFIGEDNIYFYGIAEIALFHAIDSSISLPNIIPNHHLLYGKKKASSSGEIKPPGAMELLDHYTSEQLRIHFMHASLGDKAVSFDPVGLQADKKMYDPVLYEGNILTNVFNRIIRSAFYTLQKNNQSVYPLEVNVEEQTIQKCENLILQYEKLMFNCKFDKVVELLDLFLRDANKEWASKSKTEEPNNLSQLLMNTFHVIRVCMTLMHPIAPEGCEKIRKYMRVSEDIWNWTYIFEPLSYFTGEKHEFEFLQPRQDFFLKHNSQF